MNKRYIKFVCYVGFLLSLGVLSLGGAGAVSAYQATNTPTGTITAIGGYIPTIVSTQVLDLDCGLNTPIGWGTLTPDGVWDVLCSPCMVTAFPSATPTITTTAPSPTGTLVSPTPSLTPSPTVPPIPSTGLISCDTDPVNIVTVCTQMAPDVIRFTGQLSSGWNVISFFVGADADLFLHWVVNSASVIDWTGAYGGNNHNVPNDTYLATGSGIAISSPPNITVAVGNGDFIRIVDVGVYDNALGAYPAQIGRYFFNLAGSGEAYGNVVTGPSTEYWITTVPWETVGTPAPSPTPDVGYCQAVNGGGEVPDSGFEFNGITFGSTACFDIGPIPTWDFGFLVVNVNIPWIAHLCLTNIDLGVITAFGVQISLLTISYVWGIAWAIRNLFTS